MTTTFFVIISIIGIIALMIPPENQPEPYHGDDSDDCAVCGGKLFGPEVETEPRVGHSFGENADALIDNLE